MKSLYEYPQPEPFRNMTSLKFDKNHHTIKQLRSNDQLSLKGPVRNIAI